jgi:cation transport ATPase|tara:strand:+ start:8984 stop:9388 length:405 start_codon:yes stop_codon:yes gene_type:complete
MKDILAKIFGGAAGGVAEKISNIIGQHVFSKEDKARFEKEMTQVLIDAEADQQKNVTERWKFDMASDNKLSKSVRPLTLIFLFVSTILLIFIDSGFINFAVDDEWKELLKMLLITITAAYFGGRSYEKGKSIKK